MSKSVRQSMTAMALLCLPAWATAGTVPVIVELESPAAAHAVADAREAGAAMSSARLQAVRAGLRAEQDRILQRARAQGLDFELKRLSIADGQGQDLPIDVRYTLVYNGFALNIEKTDVAAFRALQGVKAVHRETLLYPQLQASVAYIDVPPLYGDVQELTPADTANEGLEGQGVNLAVIDTGTDWTHPMLQGNNVVPPRLGILPPPPAEMMNDKVIYNLPLAEIVINDGNGHGTHVSSTAAGYLAHAPGVDRIPGTDDDIPLHGVAPQARIMSYKVCNDINSTIGSLGAPAVGCLTSVIILAIEDAVSPTTLTGFDKPVADVINMSLGGAGGPDDGSAAAADNAALMGTIVVSSAGNSGPDEATVGSPGAARHVIAVGANADPGEGPNAVDVLPAPSGESAPAHDPILAAFAADSNATMALSEPVDGHYVFAGAADTPTAVPVQVAGNICLTVRGSTAEAADQGTGLFANKALQCQAKGAIAVLLFNNEPGPIGPILAPATIPVFTLSGIDGEFIHALGYDEGGVSRFPLRINPQNPELFQPQMASFSSRGPVLGFGQVKPDITAPGVDVLAAAPLLSSNAALSQSIYALSSGTSMSSPHVAGAVALIHQAHPDWTPAQVRTALINTATNLREADGRPEADDRQTVLDQGGGLVDIDAAVSTQALMGVPGDGRIAPEILGSHSFGEVPVLGKQCVHGESIEIVIKDLSGQAADYSLRSIEDRNDLGAAAVMMLNVSSLSVPAGGSASFTATLNVDGADVDASLDAAQIMGYIIAESSGQRLSLPYYYRAVAASRSADSAVTQTATFTGHVAAGSLDTQLVEGLDYAEIPFEVDEDTLTISASLEWDVLVDGLISDLEFYLLDPAGNVLASSATASMPETLSAIPVGPGTYTYRATGYLNTDTEFTITSEQLKATSKRAQLRSVSSNGEGRVTLSWTPVARAQAYQIEALQLDGRWVQVASAGANSDSITLEEQGATNRYRLRTVFDGKQCRFASQPSATGRAIVESRGGSMGGLGLLLLASLFGWRRRLSA